MSKLQLWEEVSKTDPRFTKEFSGKGGFKGTAVNPMYLIRRATERWGPMGGDWGLRIVEEKVIEGAPMIDKDGQRVGSDLLHMVQAELYYPDGKIYCFGQTMLSGSNKYGFYTDEEAPKKSLTDALTKGLSWLGFAADVHMGMFDDVKYVNQIKEEFAKGFVSQAQANELSALVEKLHDPDDEVSSLQRFLNWSTAAAKRRVVSIENLPADLFVKAKKVLEDQVAKKEEVPV